MLTAIPGYSKRKGTSDKVWGILSTSFQESPPSVVTQDALNSSNNKLWQHVKCCLPGKLVSGSVLRVFTGGWSNRHPLPSMYQNSRLPEAKQVFSINHVVCTDSLGAVSHFNQFWIWWGPCQNPSSQMPAMGQLCKQAFLRTAVWDLLC